MRKSKIVCTLGPSSCSKEVVAGLLEAGVDVFRLNFSYGSHSGHARMVQIVRGESERLSRPVAVLQDLQGPRIRVGELKESIELKTGRRFVLTTRQIVGNVEEVPTTYKGLPEDVKYDDQVLLDDGQIVLRVLEVNGSDVICKIIEGGSLKSHKGINLPGIQVSEPSLTEKDRKDLDFGIQLGVDFVALSFVRNASDILGLREILDKSKASIQVIAKLERREAVDNLEPILKVSDGVMVARGDLGVEMTPEEVPIIQKQIISAANKSGVVVITATQMLESMTSNMRPTRAEASDVANAIFDGTDAVMLSGETAVGKYPIETLKMMVRIVETAEDNMQENPSIQRRTDRGETFFFPDAIGRAAAAVVEEMQAVAIVAFTQSGSTARLISKRRPRTPIFAFTPYEQVWRQLNLCWGTQPRLMALVEDTDRMVAEVEALLMVEGQISKGETLVILAGAPITKGAETNLLKLHRVGESG